MLHNHTIWNPIIILWAVLIACSFPGVVSPETGQTQETETVQPQMPGGRATQPPTPIAPSPYPSRQAAPSPTPASLVCRNESCQEPGFMFDYLIVTRPLFEDALTPFIAWKTSKGYRVGLITVEWIDASFPGRHLAERIKTGLHTLRRQDGVVYVLLVGDTTISEKRFDIELVMESYTLRLPWNVPTGFYRRIALDPPGEVLPSDSYFVEDRDWDPQNTGLNPVPDQKVGEGTLDATLFIGRWPVRLPQDLAPIIAKTIAAAPVSNILFTSDNSLDADGQRSCPVYPPAPNNRFFCYLDTFATARTLFYEGNAPWLQTDTLFIDTAKPGAVQGLLEKLNTANGVVFASYHGGLDCWLLAADHCYRANEIKFSNIFPLLEIESCNVFSFYARSGDSFAEQLLKSPTGPAVLTISPASVPFLEVLRNGETIGKALWRSGATYVYWPNPMELLGDPSLVAFSK